MKGPSLDRILNLADPGTYEPWQPKKGAGYHLGSIEVGGRPAYVLATDTDTPVNGSPYDGIERETAFLEHIAVNPAPLVQMLDIPAHMKTLKGKTPIPRDAMRLLAGKHGIGGTYAALARLEGLVPRVTAIFSTIGAALSFPSALCDALVMTEDAALCIGRPDAVTHMTGQKTDFHKLGGAKVHASTTGIAHAMVKTEAGALTWMRQWLSYWPTQSEGLAPAQKPVQPSRDIADVGPALTGKGLNVAFDMHSLVKALADGGSWLEMGPDHASECITGLCRIGGRPLAVVASNSSVRGGVLFPETCRKMTRFIRLCGRFRMPVVFLADTPGFMIGEQVEHDGIVQAAADLYTAIARSLSPKVCVVARKAYSAGLYAMAGAGFDAQFWAMPEASISVFGPEAISRFCEDRDMPDPVRTAAQEMLAGALDPQLFGQEGLIDQVVDWEDLRDRLGEFAAG